MSVSSFVAFVVEMSLQHIVLINVSKFIRSQQIAAKVMFRESTAKRLPSESLPCEADSSLKVCVEF